MTRCANPGCDEQVPPNLVVCGTCEMAVRFGIVDVDDLEVEQ